MFYDRDFETLGFRFSEVSLKRTLAVGKFEMDAGGKFDDVGAIVMAIGDQGNSLEIWERCQLIRERKIGMADGNPAESLLGEDMDSVFDSNIQSFSWRPNHLRSEGVRPC